MTARTTVLRAALGLTAAAVWLRVRYPAEWRMLAETSRALNAQHERERRA